MTEMIHLKSDAFSFCNFLVITVLVNIVATEACFFFTTLTKNASRASMLATAYFVHAMLFGGLFFSGWGGSKYHDEMQKVSYSSFFNFAWQSLMINEFSDRIFLFNPRDTGANLYKPGSVFLKNLSVEPDHFTLYICCLIGTAVFFFFAGFLKLALTTVKR